MPINFQDPQIWVAISFIIFFAAFGKIIWKKLSFFLDEKIKLVHEEIEEAQKLHDEAKLLLSQEKRKAQDLETEIKKIMNASKLKADEIVKENKSKINNEILNLERSGKDKIKLLEQEILKEIKLKILDKAINKSVSKLEENLSKQDHNILLSKSIKNIDSKI